MNSRPDPYFSVQGLSIVVAGGAGGLGAPLARALCIRGARLTIADIDVDRARDLARNLEAEGGEAIGVVLDVTDGVSCAGAVGQAVQEWGRLDGLINATGVYRVAPALRVGGRRMAAHDRH